MITVRLASQTKSLVFPGSLQGSPSTVGAIQVCSAVGAIGDSAATVSAGGAITCAGGGIFGASALVASERLRIAGGTAPGTPGSTDVLVGAGKLRCGDTSATSIQSAGGLTVSGDLNFTASAFRLYAVTSGTIGIASGATTQCFLNLRSSSLTSYGYIGANATDFGLTDSAGNFVISYQPGSTRIEIPSTTKLHVSETSATSVQTAGGITAAGDLTVAGKFGCNGATPPTRSTWAAWTGTATRTTIATGSATATNCAEAIKALVDDLRATGILG